MSAAGAIGDVLVLLAEHADIIADVVDVVRSGASKDSIRKALRDVKLKVSDAAFAEELGLDEDRQG